jgi:hypothetical protein
MRIIDPSINLQLAVWSSGDGKLANGLITASEVLAGSSAP